MNRSDRKNKQVCSDSGVRVYYDNDIMNHFDDGTDDRWTILLIKDGLCLYSLDGDFYTVNQGLLVSSPHRSGPRPKVAKGTEGCLLGIPSSLALEMGSVVNTKMNSIAAISPYTKMEREEIDRFYCYLSLIEMTMAEGTSESSSLELKYICQSLIASICQLYSTVSVPEGGCRKSEIAKEFLSLVAQANGRERRLEYYATRLNVSKKYLSSVISEVTGKKAGQWIGEHTIQRAMNLLETTDDGVREIAAKLNFSIADFCRYFHRYTGMTPLGYRSTKLCGKPGTIRT